MQRARCFKTAQPLQKLPRDQRPAFSRHVPNWVSAFLQPGLAPIVLPPLTETRLTPSFTKGSGLIFYLDLFRAGSRLARLEAEGELNAAIETAMQAMKTHKATSARLSTQDGEIVWRGYPDPNDRPF